MLRCCCVIVTDTDEVQAVFAGSALWLDCTSLVQPVDSLIQVSWHRDSELLYYQYVVNSRLVNYPPNTTAGAVCIDCVSTDMYSYCSTLLKCSIFGHAKL